jgi:hypothetical protein
MNQINKYKPLLDIALAVSRGESSVMKLGDVVTYFQTKSNMYDALGKTVTDGRENRQVVYVYEKTFIVSEFSSEAEIQTKTMWALGPSKNNLGYTSQYVLMDCDPRGWKIIEDEHGL